MAEEAYTREAFDSYILDYAAESHRARSVATPTRVPKKPRTSAAKVQGMTPTSPEFDAVKAQALAGGAS